MISNSKLKEKRKSFEESEWNASKFSGEKPLVGRVNKMPKRTLADILRVNYLILFQKLFRQSSMKKLMSLIKNTKNRILIKIHRIQTD